MKAVSLASVMWEARCMLTAISSLGNVLVYPALQDLTATSTYRLYV